jgi:IS30 family transposase
MHSLEETMARRYKRLSALDLEVLWSRWQRGETAVQISAVLGCDKGTVTWQVDRAGGFVPRPRRRAAWTLSLRDREEISRGVAVAETVRSMARRLGRAPSTISREIRRHGGRAVYRASAADTTAWARARRPKRCRLACQPRLRRAVEQHLRADWSPQQIAAWLVNTFPADPAMHLSHETIYRSLYVQTRGALKRALIAHLRQRHAYRRPRAAAQATRGPGQIVDIVPIAQRPASADARAVPGHWEGDLLVGQLGSQIATLVERQSRFVLLVRVPAADSASVVTALARRVRRLPTALRRSLTWDRGKEMAQHKHFTIATEVQVYFCDPQSPWQRGSNENTNGLLRQYFPKGMDLRTVTQAQLDAVAVKLNRRPRQTLAWQTPAAVFNAAVASTS